MGIRNVRTGASQGEEPSRDTEARNRCDEARDLEGIGEYARAREALGQLWQGTGARPDLDQLSYETAAEILMRVGSLTGFLGSAGQLEGAQEKAKDLLSEAMEMFTQLGIEQKVADAQNCLGICYWRSGAFDSARVILNDALARLAQSDKDLRLSVMLNLAIVERSDGNDEEALRLQRTAEPLAEETTSDILKGRFHQGFSVTLSKRGDIDSALIEDSAASYYYEKAGHKRNCVVIENNIAFELFKKNRNEEALEHLDHALRVLRGMKDKSLLPQVLKTRADVLLAQKENEAARAAAKEAVHLLDQGDEVALLVEAMTSYGTALARLRMTDEALETFARAHHRATESLTLERAAEVGVVMIRELAGMMYVGAGKFFDDSKLEFEASLIKEALHLSKQNEVVNESAAALKLGMSSRTLNSALKGRHHELLSERKPIRPRNKSIIVTTKSKKGSVAPLLKKKKA